jgi:hypothetical protein
VKLAIVGSRKFMLLGKVWTYIRTLPKDTVVVTGGAKGVDRTAETAALALGLKVEVFLPDWEKFGKGAGFARNAQIVNAADKLVAFWDGESKGTLNSIALAKQQNKLLE